MENEEQGEVQRLHGQVAGKKPCIVCGVRFARSKQAKFCAECLSGSRPASIDYAVLKALKEGRLRPIKQCQCVDCGAPARHYDHRDYNKPTEVEPVCAKCNARRPPAIRFGRDAKGNWLVLR